MRQPVNSTYKTEFISVAAEINSRTSSPDKDEYFQNVLPESIKNKVTGEKELSLIKRSGTAIDIATTGSGNMRGFFYWKRENQLFTCIGRDVRIYNATTYTLLNTLVNAVGNASTFVGFCEYLYDSGISVVVVTDGTTLSTITNAGVITAGTDPDMPVPHLPTPFFFDGYLLLVKTGTTDCYNSNLNDPLLYEPADFISAEMRADVITAIITMNNYFLLIGPSSIEYFWDAANATGTPFQRNDTPVKLSGYVGGITQHGNKIYLVGEEVEGQPNVFILEDFKIVPVGNEAIRRHLAQEDNSLLRGNVLSINGVDCYVIFTGNRTYYMDLETRLWGLLSYQQLSTFPIYHSVTINTTAGTKTLFIMPSLSNAVWGFDDTLYQDAGTNFTCTVVTEPNRFNTNANKTMGRLIVWADRPSSNADLGVQWTDDDFQSYTSIRLVNLNQEQPDIRQLGRFRKRAMKLTYTTNQSLKLYKLEVDLNVGVR